MSTPKDTTCERGISLYAGSNAWKAGINLLAKLVGEGYPVSLEPMRQYPTRSA